MLDVNDLLKPQPGFFYEPRVLWGQGYLAQRGNGPVGIISPKRDSYYNGSRWPIVLTHAITLVCHPTGLAYAGMDLIGQVPIEIGSLGNRRFSLGQIRGLLTPVASGESLEALNPFDPDPPPFNPNNVTRLRSVQNLARWDFQHTLRLPPAAYLELQLSGRAPTVADTTDAQVKADVNFYAAAPREGAQWPGSTITRTGFAVAQLTVDAAQFYYAQLFAAQGGTSEGAGPLAELPFTGLVGGPESRLYPPAQVFTSKLAQAQKATYNLPTHLTGFSVGFAQDELDAAFIAQSSSIAGPLSTTTYSRIRTRNGGTQDYWWRDGAPLAICTPTMTPGTVSKLNRPLALQPGEGFKLALPAALPAGSLDLPYVAGSSEATPAEATYYIAFCGFAAVEA
jgi:hypothetical protein